MACVCVCARANGRRCGNWLTGDERRQERRSLLEQHRMEIEELQAALQASRSRGESEDAPSASHENCELERLDVLEHEIAGLKQALEATKRDLAEAEAAGAEAERKRASLQAQAEEAQEELRALQRAASEKISSAEAAEKKKLESGPFSQSEERARVRKSVSPRRLSVSPGSCGQESGGTLGKKSDKERTGRQQNEKTDMASLRQRKPKSSKPKSSRRKW